MATQRRHAADVQQVASVSKTATSASTSTVAADRVDVDDFATDNRPVILYDGVCNLCNGAVNFMLDWDPAPGAFRMAALQSAAGKRLLRRSGRAEDDISSIVLVEEEKHYIRSEAILRIAYGLPNPLAFLSLFGFPFPLFIRDTVYDLVANNRYNILGKRDACRLWEPSFKERFVVD